MFVVCWRGSLNIRIFWSSRCYCLIQIGSGSLEVNHNWGQGWYCLIVLIGIHQPGHRSSLGKNCVGKKTITASMSVSSPDWRYHTATVRLNQLNQLPKISAFFTNDQQLSCHASRVPCHICTMAISTPRLASVRDNISNTAMFLLAGGLEKKI